MIKTIMEVCFRTMASRTKFLIIFRASGNFTLQLKYHFELFRLDIFLERIKILRKLPAVPTIWVKTRLLFSKVFVTWPDPKEATDPWDPAKDWVNPVGMPPTGLIRTAPISAVFFQCFKNNLHATFSETDRMLSMCCNYRGFELSGKELLGKRWNYPDFFGLRQSLGKNIRFERKFLVVNKHVLNFYLNFIENKPMLKLYRFIRKELELSGKIFVQIFRIIPTSCNCIQISSKLKLNLEK